MQQLVPQIWKDVLVKYRLNRVNALHQAMQKDELADWIRQFLEAELNYEMCMLSALEYRAVLCDNAYHLEK